MFRYVLRRIAAVVPILFGVSIVCFSFVHLAPGDAISALTGDNATREVVAQLKQIYGYDQPLPIQYLRWLGRILTGDLGHSIMTGRSVLSEVVPAALHTAAAEKQVVADKPGVGRASPCRRPVVGRGHS